MITKVRVRYFKRFEDQEFDLSDHVVLAGPNNSGKSTLLQAIAVWNLALQRWMGKRGPNSGSRATQHKGIPLTRKDFTALPLREMNLLWTDTRTGLKKEELGAGKRLGQPRVLSISLEGKTQGSAWELTFEFRYQGTEQVYVRPATNDTEQIARVSSDLRVVHIPPFSGIGAEETGLDQEYRDLLIGQGKPGDILRNLLLEVYQNSRDTGWKDLCGHVEDIFAYTLLPPEYAGRPFILCEYLRGIPEARGLGGLARLDIASAGSGFHQVLMLLAFFYAKPSTVLLLDEPDAHQHIVLQKQIYDTLRRIAAQRHCQLIIASHSEVVIDNTSPDLILSFFDKPHRIVSDVDRQQVREALKRLPAGDLLLAERSNGVLYVEGQTDFDLLRGWADALGHPLRRWFKDSAFWHSNQGRHPGEARGHFFALKAIRPGMRGVLVLDGDNRELPDREVGADGLNVERWSRYEAESYLLHPESLVRFVGARTLPLLAGAAEAYLKDQMPPAVYRDPLQPHIFFSVTPASKTILPGFFKAADIKVPKQEYYLVAEQMTSKEIPDEVRQKLDTIAAVFGVSS